MCDRYIGSSIAYQGYGRGLDVDIVRAVSGWAAGGLWPDLVVLLVVPDDVAARAHRRRRGTASRRQGSEFHRRVARGFAEQADDEPDTWVVVDGTGSVDEVHERVLDAVDDVLGRSAMSGTGHDVDLWSEVVGQDAAVEQLRAAAASPVHAYLIVGPEGSGKRAAARAFAADLLAAGLDDRRGGARPAPGRRPRRTRRSPWSSAKGPRSPRSRPTRSCASSSLAPPEGDLQVIVLVDFHLVGVAAPKLLKSIEEPPPTTVFVVLAEEITPELVTIASRCVQVDLAAVPEHLLVDRLVADGVEPGDGACRRVRRRRQPVARPAAGPRPRGGRAARRLVRGAGAPRRDRCDRGRRWPTSCWDRSTACSNRSPRSRPRRWRGSSPGSRRPSIEPRKGDLKRLEDRHKREQRRVRVDELRSGLATLVGRYRDELAAGGSHEDFLAAADAVQELCDGLVFNPNEGLQLRALMVRLPALRLDH